MIYKRFDTQFKSLKCCFVTIFKEAEKQPEKHLCGMVAELKISDKTSYPVWECFHNMSGVGACITLKALSYGVLVQQVIIYGVVTTTEESNKARLIQLHMDFERGTCFFKQCDGCFPLDILLNAILSHI